jgi:hypothetical protein
MAVVHLVHLGMTAGAATHICNRTPCCAQKLKDFADTELRDTWSRASGHAGGELVTIKHSRLWSTIRHSRLFRAGAENVVPS